MSSRPVIAFDVNETLLDLSALRQRFSAVLPADLMSLWFARLLHNSTVATLTGVYEAFDRLAVDALVVTAKSASTDLSEDDARHVVEGMRELPAHGDVAPALDHLLDAGFRLVTLTNSSSRFVSDQIANAGLGDRFERLLSVETVRQFKPAPAVYEWAARSVGVDIEDLLLVAAHTWDTTGAIRAGARAALVDRRGSGMGPLAEQPDMVAQDLVALARAISRSDGS